MPSYGEIAYHVSKTGLSVIASGLAIELAPYGIRVNSLTPGHYQTPLTHGVPPDREAKLKREIPLRRFGDPVELTPAALMLLSDRLSPYTTGADWVVDGGLSLRPLSLLEEGDIHAMNHVPAD